ncbi:hypothetical protein [Bdellovibrio sp. BCCA]|uniref:hypothetical protein n=1 Tax=Bdellovibrio sp. BCCA TaxID=3136281 RepID=UPI0030F339B7
MDIQTKSLLAITLTFFSMLYLFMRDMNEMFLFPQQTTASINQVEEHIVAKITNERRIGAISKSTIQEKKVEKRHVAEAPSYQENPACLMPDDIVTCLVDNRLATTCLLESDSFSLNDLYPHSEIYPDREKYESLQLISDNLMRGQKIAEEEEQDEYLFLKRRSAVICVTFRDQCIDAEKSKLVRFGEPEFFNLLSVFTPSELSDYIQLRSSQESHLGCQPVYVGSDDPEMIYRAIEDLEKAQSQTPNHTGGTYHEDRKDFP